MINAPGYNPQPGYSPNPYPSAEAPNGIPIMPPAGVVSEEDFDARLKRLRGW